MKEFATWSGNTVYWQFVWISHKKWRKNRLWEGLYGSYAEVREKCL